MASRPDGWRFYDSHLATVSTDGRDSVKSALKELLVSGWLMREESRDEGRFQGYIYEIVHRDGFTVTAEPQRLNRNGETVTNNTNRNNTDITIRIDTPLTPQGEGRFEEFWNLYPSGGRKAARKQCLEKWKREGLDEVADKVIEGLIRWLYSKDWRKDNGQYIPAPLTWLNQQRWEAQPAISTGKVVEEREFDGSF